MSSEPDAIASHALQETNRALSKEFHNALLKAGISNRGMAIVHASLAPEIVNGQQGVSIRVRIEPPSMDGADEIPRQRMERFIQRVAQFLADTPARPVQSKEMRSKLDPSARVELRQGELIFSGPDLEGVLGLYYAKMNPTNRSSTLPRHLRGSTAQPGYGGRG